MPFGVKIYKPICIKIPFQFPGELIIGTTSDSVNTYVEHFFAKISWKVTAAAAMIDESFSVGNNELVGVGLT